MNSYRLSLTAALIAALAFPATLAFAQSNSASANRPQRNTRDTATVKAEHSDIGLGGESAAAHTQHPDAQWYPEAGLGLFIHWGIASVKAMNISWPMIPGRALANKKIT